MKHSDIKFYLRTLLMSKTDHVAYNTSHHALLMLHVIIQIDNKEGKQLK